MQQRLDLIERRIERQDDGRRRAFAKYAGEVKGPAVETSQSFHHRQSEACALMASIIRTVRLHKGAAKPRQIFIGDTDAIVGAGEDRVAVLYPRRYPHPSTRLCKFDG